MPLIALITDFGLNDWFVGELKGVLFGISPQTNVIDISHAIPPSDVRAAAFTLFVSFPSFPPHTIFLSAVGNTSSGACSTIVAQTGNYIFAGPDNGALSWVLQRNDHKIWCIDNQSFTRNHPSSTFSARDILGPVAAHIANGINLNTLGSMQTNYVKLPFPSPQSVNDKIHGEIIYIDRFGNAITNIEFTHLQELTSAPSSCNVNDIHNFSIKKNYLDVKPLEGLCYIGSTGFLEIGVREGNCAAQFQIEAGQKVIIY